MNGKLLARGYVLRRAAELNSRRSVIDVDPEWKRFKSASRFREDPLPDRPMRNRGVTLPKLKFLERPDP